MRRAPALALALAVAGCGSNRPEIPPELLTSGGCEAPGYPAGPYGSEPGETVQNICFQGFRSPEAGSTAALQEVSFADFYDPEGTRFELLLPINSAAIWCSACQVEHQTLPAHYTELAPQGLGLVSALFQDAKRDPSDRGDLDAWIEAFEPNFPMVLDPDYQLGIYASAETAPLNLVVDARTMRIQRKFIGDQAAVLWPAIEEELSSRE